MINISERLERFGQWTCLVSHFPPGILRRHHLRQPQPMQAAITKKNQQCGILRYIGGQMIEDRQAGRQVNKLNQYFWVFFSSCYITWKRSRGLPIFHGHVMQLGISISNDSTMGFTIKQILCLFIWGTLKDLRMKTEGSVNEEQQLEGLAETLYHY